MSDWPNAEERAFLRRHTTPERIQAFIEEHLVYDPSRRIATPRDALRERLGDCATGGLLACTALAHHNQPARIVLLRTDGWDVDHIIVPYRRHGHWGAIGQSNFPTLRARLPVYRTLRELALSYFDGYRNPKGWHNLRGYSAPFDVTRFPHDWRTSVDGVAALLLALDDVRQYDLFPPSLLTKTQ